MIRSTVCTAVLSAALLVMTGGCSHPTSSRLSDSEVASDLALIAKHCTSLQTPGANRMNAQEQPGGGLARTRAANDTFWMAYNADSTAYDLYMKDSTLEMNGHFAYFAMDNTPLSVNRVSAPLASGDTSRYRMTLLVQGTFDKLSISGSGSTITTLWLSDSADSLSNSFGMEYSSDCAYVYTYEADGFSMEFKNCHTDMRMTNDGYNVSMRGDIEFLGRKYVAHISGAYEFSEADFDSSAEYLRADLMDRSDTKVGTMVMTYDSGVKLYDLDGNIIASGAGVQ